MKALGQLKIPQEVIAKRKAIVTAGEVKAGE
jgi:hypothetical protein